MRTAERKYQTHAQQLGFADPDLKDPAHDELVMRLYRALPHFVARHVAVVPDCKHHCYNDQWAAEKKGYSGQAIEPPPSTHLEVLDQSLEHPVTKGEGKYKTVIGFADLRARISVPTGVCLEGEGTEWRWAVRTQPIEWLFEVKPAMLELGVLLRQLQLYREFTEAVIWVAAPDFRNAAILQEQGFWFMPLDAHGTYGCFADQIHGGKLPCSPCDIPTAVSPGIWREVGNGFPGT